MPNHCSNCVIFEGPKEDITKMASMLVTEDHVLKFDLNKFVPIPEALENTVSGSTIGRYYLKGTDIPLKDMGFKFEDAEGNIYERSDKIELRAFTEKQLAELMVAYGATNWYEWKTANWGTKWGYYDCSEVQVEETRIEFTADTAWCPAHEALLRISERFPSVTITNHFAECGSAYMGTREYKNGEVEDVYSYEGDFYIERPEDMDEDEWYESDESERLVPEVANFIEEHGMHTGG